MVRARIESVEKEPKRSSEEEDEEDEEEAVTVFFVLSTFEREGRKHEDTTIRR